MSFVLGGSLGTKFVFLVKWLWPAMKGTWWTGKASADPACICSCSHYEVIGSLWCLIDLSMQLLTLDGFRDILHHIYSQCFLSSENACGSAWVRWMNMLPWLPCKMCDVSVCCRGKMRWVLSPNLVVERNTGGYRLFCKSCRARSLLTPRPWSETFEMTWKKTRDEMKWD